MKKPNSTEIGRVVLAFCIAVSCCMFFQNSLAAEKDQPNVLLIMVDDMNDWVGAFGGHPQAITPHMDKLAEKSIIFKNAYCSAALCNPSRTSMLTGYLPSTTGVYGNSEHFRDMKGFEETVTLPQYFEKNGYITAAAGKIFHSPRGPEKEPRPGSDPGSFQKEHKGNLGTAYPADENKMLHGMNLKQKGIHSHFRRTFDWYGVDQPTKETHDWKSADYCAEFLKKEHDKPFFLACGIFRPHLPWYAPKEFFDLYDVEDMIVPEVIKNDLDDVGKIGQSMSQSVLHKEILKNNKWKDAVRAYLANLSFADVCVGHVLDALNSSAYNENTIIVLMGDHGWHLGEKEHWSKNVLWERSAKTPLIIFNPKPGEKGVCTRIVSLIDVYPTLLDLCDLPEKRDVEGQSILPLLLNPEIIWNWSALTSKDKNIHTLRNENFRYISYSDGFEELYDHRVDPNEWKNIAGEAQNKEILIDFRKELKSILSRN